MGCGVGGEGVAVTSGGIRMYSNTESSLVIWSVHHKGISRLLPRLKDVATGGVGDSFVLLPPGFWGVGFFFCARFFRKPFLPGREAN